MTFDEVLRLVAIGVGILLIILAALVAVFAEDGGCLCLIGGFIGVGFLVYGFTGDAGWLQKEFG